MSKIYNTRHVWVYVNLVENPLRVNVNSWVSPSPNACPFPDMDTPHEYTLTRNDLRYIVHSEVQLSQNTAIRIAGQLYDSEFIIAPKINMKRRIDNR